MRIDDPLFVYFASNPLDPLPLLQEVVRDDKHPYHRTTMDALMNVPKAEVDNTIDDPKFRFCLTTDDPVSVELEARTEYLARFLQKEIPRRKYQLLLEQHSQHRPPPYDHKAIADLPFDDDCLISIDHFAVLPGAFERNGFRFTMLPVAPGSNSSFWLHNYIRSHASTGSMRVRLDPWVWGPVSTFQPMEYRMWVWGKPLNWAALLTLREPLHGRWTRDPLSSQDILFTDFVWQPSKTELTFTCEEIQSSETIDYRGTRYFHAIYSKTDAQIHHCDGAIRILTKTEYGLRGHYHVKDAEVRKTGKRIKVFRTAAVVPTDYFCGLASAFYVWNQDFLNYFALRSDCS